MTILNDRSCIVCGSKDLTIFFEVSGLPAHIGILWPDRETAIGCPKGDICLAFCAACGFITNMTFDPARMEYSQAYDNTLLFSPVYREYARSSALRLIDRYGLRNKSVIEIGCGKGDFLALICELGNNHGVGFDPSFDPARFEGGNSGRVTFIQDFYSEKYGDYGADLVCCRYVFEHIPDPVTFLGMVRRAIGENRETVVYFEVPNVSFILRDLSGWDIIYEHCSYFCRSSLAKVFTSSGFSVRNIEETFDGQYLWIEAVPSKKSAVEIAPVGEDRMDVEAEIMKFKEGFRGKMAAWRNRLEELHRAGRRTVIWGAGAKGVGFLNMIRAGDTVSYAVDINPHKRSMHMPGTGHKIVAPGDILNDPPDVVVVMNHVYLDEIRNQVERIGISPEFMVA